MLRGFQKLSARVFAISQFLFDSEWKARLQKLLLPITVCCLPSRRSLLIADVRDLFPPIDGSRASSDTKPPYNKVLSHWNIQWKWFFTSLSTYHIGRHRDFPFQSRLSCLPNHTSTIISRKDSLNHLLCLVHGYKRKRCRAEVERETNLIFHGHGWSVLITSFLINVEDLSLAL